VGIWKDGGKVFAEWLGKKDAIIDDFCSEDKCNSSVEVYDFKNTIKKLDFYFGDRQAVIVLSDNCLFAVEIQINNSKKAQKIYCGEEVDFILEDNNYLYIKDGTSLFETLL
jgi:hypothetical protein